MHSVLLTLFAGALLATHDAPSPVQPAVDEAPLVEQFLLEGKLTEGEAALQERLEQAPKDDQARFGLATLQFLQTVERFMQSLYRYGAHDPFAGMLPMVRLPVPHNPEPDFIEHSDLRGIFQGWIDGLARTETTLAEIRDPDVKLPLHFGMVRLDFNGDGKAHADETLWKVYTQLNRMVRVTPEQAENFVIAFDAGDVHWLRGYCHLLMALGEFLLAHDGKELFEHTAQLFFARPVIPYDFLQRPKGVFRMGNADLSDAIAFIHLIRLPVDEPQRMTAALEHLQEMLRQSRESWTAILTETDDDREWIPNSKQTSVIPNMRVTEEMIKAWFEFLGEADGLLTGRKLVPFWRDAGDRGVNLRRAFTEPTTFDLVLWVQGTAAVPYLEKGELTSPATWRRLQRIFRGNFFTFFLWFN
jgi:hypothetical protein